MSQRSSDAPRLLCIGAHPDDCEIRSAGLAALWTGRGGAVRFLSVTDGNAGHHEIGGGPLARSRRAEALAGAAAVGAESVVLDIPDGTLLPTIENRNQIIRAIREFEPDVVATHRPNDYHPDHRYTGVLVQDALSMIMVPNIVPNVTVPPAVPVVIMMSDRFTRPYPFQPDLVFDLTSVIEKKVDAITSHERQMTEWLPWIKGYADEMPTDPAERGEFIRRKAGADPETEADRFRAELITRYGAERGSAARYAEAYEVSEYGTPLSDEMAKTLFPF
ncbi:PIG-L deacetylase family protein [Spongiactinospora sp. TRM90649]|uniref:PIG-L deacetylase family protein n=1 Tax=Spongiactinospora sp. TRM90649 TaxID=3031114 RepID=UPI0023F70356|nr:PIG-L deacetylase family protein [Spongiactinospora sp. TRM90649]